MSEQGLRALLKRAESDQGFRERLEAAPTPDAKRQVVREAGFDVERSDLTALRSMTGMQDLSDDDLEKIAAGTATLTGLADAGGVVAVVLAGAFAL